MNQKLSDWSSVAEIVAAIGVILSLLFVGFQIQDGNRERIAATIQASLDSEMTFQAEAARHAGTWDKLSKGQELAEGEETRRAITLFGMLMTVYENQFHQYNSGYLSRPPSEVLETAVHFPVFELWRVTGGATSRSPEFMRLVDETRERMLRE